MDFQGNEENPKILEVMSTGRFAQKVLRPHTEAAESHPRQWVGSFMSNLQEELPSVSKSDPVVGGIPQLFEGAFFVGWT